MDFPFLRGTDSSGWSSKIQRNKKKKQQKNNDFSSSLVQNVSNTFTYSNLLAI